MHFDQLTVTSKEGYTIVKLNRPHEMNAISRHMMDELKLSFLSLEEDPQVRAVILTGGDMVFCAGHDIKEMAALSDTEIEPHFKKITDYMQLIYSFRKPIIAAVGGIALGGGFNLAVLCDLIIASESAIFGHPELRYGINPLLDPLRRVVGLAKAKEITMMGEPIGAKEAFKLDIVNKVAPPERFMAVAESYAQELTRMPPLTLQAIKRASDIVPRLDKRTALAYELEVTTLLFSRSETKELIKKALKK
jgi:enoyl-CoA hydratase/carnithine racemase